MRALFDMAFIATEPNEQKALNVLMNDYEITASQVTYLEASAMLDSDLIECGYNRLNIPVAVSPETEEEKHALFLARCMAEYVHMIDPYGTYSDNATMAESVTECYKALTENTWTCIIDFFDFVSDYFDEEEPVFQDLYFRLDLFGHFFKKAKKNG